MNETFSGLIIVPLPSENLEILQKISIDNDNNKNNDNDYEDKDLLIFLT